MRKDTVADKKQLPLAIKITLGVVLNVLFILWMRKSNLKKIEEGSIQTVLRYPKNYLILGVVGFLFFVTCAFFSYFSPTGGPAVSAGFLLFAILGVLLIMYYYNERCIVRSYGFEYQTVFLNTKHARWEEITSIRYISYLYYFLCRKKDGTKIRVSVVLVGLPIFASNLLENVSPDVIHPESIEAIRQTANGNPPDAF